MDDFNHRCDALSDEAMAAALEETPVAPETMHHLLECEECMESVVGLRATLREIDELG